MRTSQRTKSCTLVAALLWALLGIVAPACSGGKPEAEPETKGKADKVESDKAPPPSEDDFAGYDPVPMALLGGETYAAVQSALEAPGLAMGSYGDLGGASGAARAQEESAPGGAEAPPLGRAIAAAPGRAGGELKKLLTELESLQARLFGAGGLLATQLVKVPIDVAGVGSKAVPTAGPGLPDVAVVRAFGPASSLPYGVDLYHAGAPGSGVLELRTSLRFAPAPGDASKLGVLEVDHAGERRTDGSRQRLAARLDLGARMLRATFGDHPMLSEANPERTSMQLELPAEGETVARIFGAYKWRRTAPVSAAAVLATRYAVVANGDIEAFRAVSDTGRPDLIVQEQTFLPAEERTAGAALNAARFASHPYSVYTARFLADLVRVDTVNRACATTGDAFRSAFSDGTVPAVVAAAPADLCKAAPGVASDGKDATASALVAAACDAAIPVLLPVNLAATGEQSTYDLCTRYRDIRYLRNPGVFAAAAAGPEPVAAEVETQFAALVQRLSASPDFPAELAQVLDDVWIEVAVVAASELK